MFNPQSKNPRILLVYAMSQCVDQGFCSSSDTFGWYCQRFLGIPLSCCCCESMWPASTKLQKQIRPRTARNRVVSFDVNTSLLQQRLLHGWFNLLLILTVGFMVDYHHGVSNESVVFFLGKQLGYPTCCIPVMFSADWSWKTLVKYCRLLWLGSCDSLLSNL